MALKTQKMTYMHGSKSCLIVAPHGGGPTDLRTALMAEIIAEKTDGFAVINTGWVRPWNGHQEGTNKPTTGPKQADLQNGIANLNDLRHCRKKPLKKEFLKPLNECKNFILTKYKKANIFIIHGMDDTIRDYKGVDVVVGFGDGTPPRNTCPVTFKDRFISCLALEKFHPAQGKVGGRLSAWDSHNLNQLYIGEDKVNSIQVEIALTLRDSDKKAAETAVRIAEAINRTCNLGSVQFLKVIPER